MTRSSSLPRRLVVLLGSMAIIAACSGATPSASVAPSSEASASVAPSASEVPFEATAYPADAEAPCGVDPYTGLFKKITAVDRLTVEFQLCNPDVAFLSKVAFSAFGIQDSAYLEAHAADKSYLDNPNGTGPYKLGSWEKGNRLVLERLRRLLGRGRPDAERRVPMERRGSPALARAPGRLGRRHRQPGHR